MHVPPCVHYTHYFIQIYPHFNQNLAFLSYFLHPFFIAWVTLVSFFPSLNALKHLSIVLFTPFYCLIRPVLHKTAYISIKTLHSFLISFATAMRRIFHRIIHATNFPATNFLDTNFPCTDLNQTTLTERFDN